MGNMSEKIWRQQRRNFLHHRHSIEWEHAQLDHRKILFLIFLSLSSIFSSKSHMLCLLLCVHFKIFLRTYFWFGVISMLFSVHVHCALALCWLILFLIDKNEHQNEWKNQKFINLEVLRWKNHFMMDVGDPSW